MRSAHTMPSVFLVGVCVTIQTSKFARGGRYRLMRQPYHTVQIYTTMIIMTAAPVGYFAQTPASMVNAGLARMIANVHGNSPFVTNTLWGGVQNVPKITCLNVIILLRMVV